MVPFVILHCLSAFASPQQYVEVVYFGLLFSSSYFLPWFVLFRCYLYQVRWCCTCFPIICPFSIVLVYLLCGLKQTCESVWTVWSLYKQDGKMRKTWVEEGGGGSRAGSNRKDRLSARSSSTAAARQQRLSGTSTGREKGRRRLQQRQQ